MTPMGDMSKQCDTPQQVPPPLLLSAIVCDSVIVDAFTGKATVVGVFSTINARRYPARHHSLSVFCEMTGGRGTISVMARLIDLQDEEKALVEQRIGVEFADPLIVNSVILNFRGIPLPHPGEYRFQIYAGSEYCGERRIICRKIEEPGGNQNG
ncbi:MAG TPA: hypothetical protein ENN87_15155 [Phycisphaerales bacterium]|nr:hypothetical protein [Phycisphaerales bacterium]